MGRGETKRVWPCFRTHWAGRCGGKWGRWEGSSELGLAHPSRLLQIVTTTPAISGDFPENSEHGVPDSVSQSWDVIWCQPFSGHWGQHSDLTSPWEEDEHSQGLSAQDSAHSSGPVSELSTYSPQPFSALPLTLDNCLSACQMPRSLQPSCTKPSSNPTPDVGPFHSPPAV